MREAVLLRLTRHECKVNSKFWNITCPARPLSSFIVCDATCNAHESDTNDSYNIYDPFMDIICCAAGKKSYYWKEISKNQNKFYPDNKKNSFLLLKLIFPNYFQFLSKKHINKPYIIFDSLHGPFMHITCSAAGKNEKVLSATLHEYT